MMASFYISFDMFGPRTIFLQSGIIDERLLNMLLDVRYVDDYTFRINDAITFFLSMNSILVCGTGISSSPFLC